MKEFDKEKIIFDKMTAVRHFFPNRVFVYSYMVPSLLFRANRLLLQLLMEQFDTLPVQYRHIEHMHKGVWLKKIIFDKMAFFPS